MEKGPEAKTSPPGGNVPISGETTDAGSSFRIFSLASPICSYVEVWLHHGQRVAPCPVLRRWPFQMFTCDSFLDMRNNSSSKMTYLYRKSFGLHERAFFRKKKNVLLKDSHLALIAILYKLQNYRPNACPLQDLYLSMFSSSLPNVVLEIRFPSVVFEIPPVLQTSFIFSSSFQNLSFLNFISLLNL